MMCLLRALLIVALISCTDAVAAADEETMTQRSPTQLLAALSARRTTQHRRAAEQSWDRNPFAPAGTTDVAMTLILSGILWDPAQPIAIINGRTVKIQDILDGHRVLNITQHYVTISDGETTRQLDLHR